MTQADAIKILAVVTATPRWVGALLAAEGLIIPPEWLPWWTVASVVFAAAMAGVEGWSFAYVFAAWRRAQGRAASRLLALGGLSAVVFVAVLAPYIAAQAYGIAISDVLSARAAMYVWSACVAASTITIVASVGYAQKAPRAQVVRTPPATPEPTPALPFACDVCGAAYAKQQSLAAHLRKHKGRQ